MNHAFVITCYNTYEIQPIYKLVESIRKYHKNSKIIIVDSGSPNKDYYDNLRKYNIIIEDISNKHRENGTIWYVYKKYPKIEFFFFLQDSMICNENCLSLMGEEVICLRYFPSWDGKGFNGKPGLLNTRCGWADDVPKSMGGLGFIYKDPNGLDDRNWLEQQLQQHTNLKIPHEWYSILGPIFFINRKLLTKVKETGIDKIMPMTKMESCMMERIWGIVFNYLNIDMSLNSFQKYYLHQNYEPNKYFSKIVYGNIR